MYHSDKPELFISYSHQDQRWLNELLTHLTPLKNRLDCWSDREIAPGGQWRAEIERALNSAKVAVLLVSPAFLASSFITESELPKLLGAAKERGLTILWIPVSASNYKHTELSGYQAAHTPERPLDKLRRSNRQQALVEISEKILNATGSSHGPEALGQEPYLPEDGGQRDLRARPEEGSGAAVTPSPLRAFAPREPEVVEDSPILRRSRRVWAVLAAVLGITLACFPLPLPLPETPVSAQVPFLTWRQIGWVGIGIFLILCCLIRYLREGFINKAADQLTDSFLLITSSLLDLTTHWRHKQRRWAIGLVIAAILISPAALYGFGKLRSHIDWLDNLSEYRSALLRFACYGRLQGGNEADLLVLTKTYGSRHNFPPEALSTPELRVLYGTMSDLYQLQNDVLKDDFELRRRKILDFWKLFLQPPCGEPPVEEVDLKDYLTYLALRARVRSLILSHDSSSEGLQKSIEAAEAEYSRLQMLASRLGEKQGRRPFNWVAFNGLGTLKVFRYRLLMSQSGNSIEHRKASLLNEAHRLYQKSRAASDGDAEGEAKMRTANNEADLEMYLLKESLTNNETFAEALDSNLYHKYNTFRDKPASIKEWIKTHADSLEERARFSRNPIFFLTVAQIYALAAERLLQEKPECKQRRAKEDSPFCDEVDRTLRNGFYNLATAIFLGQPARGIAKEPKKSFVCVFFSNPVTQKDAEFLFSRFKARPELKSCM